MSDCVVERRAGTSEIEQNVRASIVKSLTELRHSGFFQILLGTLLATVLALRVVWRVDQALFLWPVSAAALGLALPFFLAGWKRRIILQSAAAVGFLGGASVVGMPLWLALRLAAILCLDMWIGQYLLGGKVRHFDDLKKQANISRLLILVIPVPILDGMLGGAAVSELLKQPLLHTVLLSVFSNALGWAVVLPAILLIQTEVRRGSRKLLLPPFKAILSGGLFVASASFIFWQNRGPFLFMAFPPMVVLLLSMGLEGAVFSSITLSAIGWVATINGHGPILLMTGTTLEHLLALQAFVLVCLTTALPIGALIDERKEAEHAIAKALLEKSQSLEENRRLYASLQASNDLFTAFMSNGPFASFIKEADGSMLFYNKFLAQMGGVTEQAWIGLKDHEIWPAEMAAEYRRHDVEVLKSNLQAESDDVSPGPDGAPTFWKTLKFPYYDAARARPLLAGISFDVTLDVLRQAALEDSMREKAKLAQQLGASRHLLENFLQHSPNLNYVKDDEGKFVFYNREVEKLFGISSIEWIGKTIAEVRPQAEAERYIVQDQEVLGSGRTVENIDLIVDRNGVTRKLQSVKFSYRDIDGRVMLAKISQDITAQMRQQEELADASRRLELLAMTDALTGLSNRRAFESRAEIEFSICIKRHRPLSILVLDVDNFKRRNDTYGHAAGDEALRVLGKVLKDCVRVGDIASRLGGEEFGFLLPETDAKSAMGIAERVQVMLRLATNGPLELTVSIGVATLDKTTHTWERLLSRADDSNV